MLTVLALFGFPAVLFWLTNLQLAAFFSIFPPRQCSAGLLHQAVILFIKQTFQIQLEAVAALWESAVM